MKASELRIGNYLALPTRGEDVVIVEEIFANDFVVCDASSNEWPITDYAPIPLTEEWLLKLGFEFSHHGEISNDNFIIEKYHDGYHYTGGEGVAFGTPIVYVHQLQNLYFALTGEELKTQ